MLSSEEMSHVLIGGTVEKEGDCGTEVAVRWETLVPPDLASEAAPDPRNECRPPRHPLWVHAWFRWVYAIVKTWYRLVGPVFASRGRGR